MTETVQGSTRTAPLLDAGGAVRDAAVAEGEIHDSIGEPVTTSPPVTGKWAQADYLFVEQAAPGTFQAVFPIVAGMTILDLALIFHHSWYGAATFNASDEAGNVYILDFPVTNGFYGARDDDGLIVEAATDGYNFINLQAYGAGLVKSYGLLQAANAGGSPGIPYPDDDELTMTLVQTETPPDAAGIMVARVLFAWPLTPTDADFTPA